jgi:steroid delta-isomerase-like uncharacterized protein
MTPEEMDAVFARHCAAENAKDVEAIIETLTEDVEHDMVGDPLGVLTDRAAIAKRYQDLFDVLTSESMTSLRRYHGADFFVDESLCTGTVGGDFMGVPGDGRTISFRVLHVCEFRDGRMSRENVWLDSAAIIQQLTA